VSISGNSTFCGPVRLNATSGPRGEHPTGHFTCGSFLSGPVTCLNVHGKDALLTFQDHTFGSVAVRTSDNGSAGTGHLEAIPGFGCAHPQLSYVEFGFTGHIVVIDAPG
jgi:hypothetical protein